MQPVIALAVLAGIGILVAVVVFAAQHKQAADQAWSEAARRLGLRLNPGSFLKGRSLRGRHRGLAVKVWTYTQSTGQSSQSYTGYRVRYPSLQLGLKLKRQGTFSGLARMFGQQDIAVGHPLFDDAVIVQARSRTAVQEFLTPLRRKKVLRALQSYKGLKITDTEIKWSARGTETSSDRLEERVRRLCDLGRVLVDDERENTPLARGLVAQRAGRLDEALEELDAAVREGDDPDARVARGEALITSGRFEEAVAVLGDAERALEGDAEVAGLAAEARRRVEARSAAAGAGALAAGLASGPGAAGAAPAEPAAPPAAPAAETDEGAAAALPDAGEPASVEPDAGEAATGEPAANEPVAGEPVAGEPADLDELSATLFAPGRMSFEVAREFEEQWAGRPVRWSGTLERLEHYYSDVAFGSGPGTRAVLGIGELADDGYGGKAIQAVVQLPEAAREELRPRIGERFELTGRLVRCDAFMRNLFVADGRLA